MPIIGMARGEGIDFMQRRMSRQAKTRSCDMLGQVCDTFRGSNAPGHREIQYQISDFKSLMKTTFANRKTYLSHGLVKC